MKKQKMTYLFVGLGCISILLLTVFIHKFTTFNLNFWHKSTKEIPDLSKPLQNGDYKIERVINGIWNEIRYDPVNDFYLIAQNETITKLNSKGDITFKLNMNERDLRNMPDFMDYHRPSYFVISWYGIYDLSKEKPYLEKFDTKWNEDGKMEWDEWLEKFNSLYESSDTVLWGFRKSFDGMNTTPLYFKKNGKWVILYSMKGQSQIYSDSAFIKFKLNYKQDFIPDKSHKLYLLKDVQHGNAYSDYNNFDDNYSTDYPENKMEYGKVANIETLFFNKEVYNDAPYSFIPSDFGGTAVNKLTIHNNSFTFKSKAIKGAGLNSSEIGTYFYLFEVPTKFKMQTTLSFLYYKYPTNWNADGNAGVYVIRKM